MESFWIAKSCHEKNIPFCCLKYVTDDNKANKSISVTKQLPLLEKHLIIFSYLFLHKQNYLLVLLFPHLIENQQLLEPFNLS